MIKIPSILLGHARWSSALVCGFLLAALPAGAATITQTIDEASLTASNWNSAVWGSPNAVPTSGNIYVVPSPFALRTTSGTAAQTFSGGQLQVNSGGNLRLKHNNGIATANILLNGGTITYNQGPGGTNSPLGGTLQLSADSKINSTVGAASKDVWLYSTMSGSGNLTVDMTTNCALILLGTNTDYSGNWTNISGRLEVGVGSVNGLGSGMVTLVNNTNWLTFNSTNDQLMNSPIAGAGFVLKSNLDTVTFAGNNTFTGALTNQAGTLVLAGSGAQAATVTIGNGVLRIANSAALPPGSTLVATANNTQTGRLELSNNVTIATGNPIAMSRRTGPTVALESISGANTISDQIRLQGGGVSPLVIQADSGATLTLAGGVSSDVTGIRDVSLQGVGNGTVSGFIDDGLATPMSVFKADAGTWVLNVANTYSGSTTISNGVLALGANGSIANSAVINLGSATATLDVTAAAGGLTLGGSQILAGRGTVSGNVTTSPGSFIQVGFTNQYGPLSLGNGLLLNGGETVQFDVSAATNDVLNIAGSLTLNGSTTIEIDLPLGFTTPGTYRLINYSGTIQGGGSFNLATPPGQQSIFQLDTSIPGQVNLVVTGTPATLTWSGDNSGNAWDVDGTANWNAQTKFFFNGDNVTFDDSGSAVPDINVTGAVLPGSVTINNTAEAYIFDGAGISSAGSLVKSGGNTAAFTSDANNFSGPINIQAGTLAIGNGGSTGSLGTGAIADDGELQLNKSSLGANLSQTITGSGAVQVTGGGASLALAGSNSYTGVTTIDNGCQLNILNNSALGTTNGGTVVQAGGSVRFTSLGNWTVAEPLVINGNGLATSAGALYANTAGNQATWTGPITVGSPSQIRIINGSVRMTLAGPVMANEQALETTPNDATCVMTFQNTLSLGTDPVLAALTTDGSGTVVLAGGTNIAGSTTISSGTLLITTTNTPQIGDITLNGGTLQLGSGALDGAMPSGAINLAASGTKLAINSSNTFTMNSPLSGVGSLSLLDFGTLIVNSTNTFTGNVTTGNGAGNIGGIIGLFNSFGLGDGTAAKTVTLTHASVQLHGGVDVPSQISFLISGGTQPIDLAGGFYPVHSIAGSNAVEGSLTLNTGAGDPVLLADSGSTLSLNGLMTANSTGRTLYLGGAGNGYVNGDIYDNGANIPKLTKQGGGTWTLNTEEDYSGATTIQGGTLALGATASVPNTTTIQIVSNAVFDVSAISGGFNLGGAQALQGIGSVGGDVNAFGTVSPGPLGNLSFSSSLVLMGTTVMEVNNTNTPNSDTITAPNLTFGGTLTVTNTGDALQAGDTFHLFSVPVGGTFAVTNLPALASTNLFWDTSLLNSQGILKVGSNVAPSPTLQLPKIIGTNFMLQVDSQSGFNYVLEATPQLVPTSWTALQTNAGGGTLTFTIPVDAANQQWFFRIHVQ